MVNTLNNNNNSININKGNKITNSNLLKKSYELKTDRSIAMDFAEIVYKEFDTLIKSVILFGSAAKGKSIAGSDIDIILIVDDASIKFDEKFIIWYREKLGELIKNNPYKRDLHINTIKITTWWEDLQRGDPTVINIIRYGEALIDIGGFFSPLKMLLQEGRIKLTPESIYTVINRVPGHILRSRLSEMSSIEGCYWAYVESAQAILMALRVLPPSPEHIPALLQKHFVNKRLLNKKYIRYFIELSDLHKKIIHGAIKNLDGKIIDYYQEKSEEFFKIAINLLNKII